MLIQEHWLHDGQLQDGFHERHIPGIASFGISGMDSSDLLKGRPYGGCAILWRKSLLANISPIESENRRFCAVSYEKNGFESLLFDVYMPSDTIYDIANVDVFNEVLSDISRISHDRNCDYLVLAGDFNTDLSRKRSSHTRYLKAFIETEKLTDLRGLQIAISIIHLKVRLMVPDPVWIIYL